MRPSVDELYRGTFLPNVHAGGFIFAHFKPFGEPWKGVLDFISLALFYGCWEYSSIRATKVSIGFRSVPSWVVSSMYRPPCLDVLNRPCQFDEVLIRYSLTLACGRLMSRIDEVVARVEERSES